MAPRLAILSAVALTLASIAHAAGPQFWRMEGTAPFLDGELLGLSLDSEGRLRLGPVSRALFDPETPNAWCVARDGKGALYVGTGNDGRVFRIESGHGTVIFDAHELEVHAVAVGPDGRLYAATSPDGAVYVIDASGTAKPFFDPPEKYIWALAFDAAGRLHVATGGEGRVYRVAPDGKAEVVLTSSQTHILSLAFDASGRLYAGSAPEGMVYRVDAAGRVFVVVDSPFREIKALDVAGDGSVYAAAIDGRAAEAAVRTPPVTGAAGPPPPVPMGEVTVTESFAVVPPAGGTPISLAPAVETPVTGTPKGALLRIRPTGETDTLWTSPDDVPHALLRLGTGILLGTGNKGKLYRVAEDGSWALVATLPAEQVTALAREGEGAILITSNPARVLALEAGTSHEGTFVSKVKDTETVSSWGQLRWEGASPDGSEVRLQTRSGNTSSPDATWTDWSAPSSRRDGEPIRSERARFLQIKLTLVGKDGTTPVVEAVSAAYLQRNLAPKVQTITVHPPGEAFQKPISVSGEPEILGQDPDPLASAATSRATAGSPPAISFSRKLYQRGLRTISWKADDPNGDPLVYDVQYRMVGDARWRPLRRGLTEPVLAWDTSTVPNGRYLVRVVASDAPGNPPSLALTGWRDSPSFDVDNTPPTLGAALEPGRRDRIRATVRDAGSPVRKLEMSIDAGRWEEVRPIDGINDSHEESYEIALPAAAGPRVVVLRATDQLGNVATVRIDVP
jgi:sugar lactone lactonase YvrE